MSRIYTTPQGDVDTTDVPMKDLAVGDLFVQEGVYREAHGVHNALYLVTGDCASHEHGWLFVRDLTVDPEAVRGDGTLECEGFFSYPPDTLMHRVRGDFTAATA